MLRRKPTAIKLTTNDLAVYDDFKRAKDAASDTREPPVDPHDRVRLPAASGIDPRSRQKTREERIGVAGGASASGAAGSRLQ